MSLKDSGQLVLLKMLMVSFASIWSLTRVDRSKVSAQLLEEMSRRSYSDAEVVAFVDDLVADANVKMTLNLAEQCRPTGKPGL